VTYQWGQSRKTVFEHNVFHGRHAEIPPGSSGTANRPPLLQPGRGTNGLASLEGYKLSAVPVLMRGRFVPNHGGRDFWGQPLPLDVAPCIGDCEGGRPGPRKNR
jgi:hypothetical protein